MCVQRFNDSQCSAIHTTFRASLRSSSMRAAAIINGPVHTLQNLDWEGALGRVDGPSKGLVGAS